MGGKSWRKLVKEEEDEEEKEEEEEKEGIILRV